MGLITYNYKWHKGAGFPTFSEHDCMATHNTMAAPTVTPFYVDVGTSNSQSECSITYYAACHTLCWNL